MSYSLLYVLTLFLFMGVVHFASLNINGERDIRKRAHILKTMLQRKIDVLFLQETHSDSTNAGKWEMSFDGLSVLSHCTSLSGGVAVLF